MKFGFFVDPDTTRYCYLRLRRLKGILKEPKVLDELAAELEISAGTGKPATPKSKLAAIERRIEELRGAKQSLWYEVPAPEILAALIFSAGKAMGAVVDELFSAVHRVQELASPLVNWLRLDGFTSHAGGQPSGPGRANLIGYRGGQFLAGTRIVEIAAINDAGELNGALEARPSRMSTHASYLACTPAMAAESLWAQSSVPGVLHWDADALSRKLKASGCGLLLVEGEAVAQVIAPRMRKLDNATIAELVKGIQAANPIKR